MAIDLVCGMEVSESVAEASLRFEGVTYTFCSEGCRAEFERHPQDYLKPAVSCCDEQSKVERFNV